MTEAKPPSSSSAGRPRTITSLTRSRPSPLSRNIRLDSGEITYGGFATTRSNRSPATGSRRLPCRSSTFCTPFRARLKRAKASARSFTSVATTRSACREASSA
jgi:hypothetical protein